jgi:hypothetical protein
MPIRILAVALWAVVAAVVLIDGGQCSRQLRRRPMRGAFDARVE